MEYLRQFSFVSVLLRLILATIAGGVIGYGRTKRNRTAGFRTYMITAIGAALAILISLYEYEMMLGPWADIVDEVGMKFDASRIAAQTISGIGFLAAGSIIAVEHSQVEGLTTAAGLFASVCMGIAAGAGYFECVVTAVILIVITLEVMEPYEALYKRRTRNITFYAEFDHIESVQEIVKILKERDSHIYSIDVERMHREKDLYPSAVFSLKLGKGYGSHSEVLSAIAELPCVFHIEELIS